MKWCLAGRQSLHFVRCGMEAPEVFMKWLMWLTLLEEPSGCQLEGEVWEADTGEKLVK